MAEIRASHDEIRGTNKKANTYNAERKEWFEKYKDAEIKKNKDNHEFFKEERQERQLTARMKIIKRNAKEFVHLLEGTCGTHESGENDIVKYERVHKEYQERQAARGVRSFSLAKFWDLRPDAPERYNLIQLLRDEHSLFFGKEEKERPKGNRAAKSGAKVARKTKDELKAESLPVGDDEVIKVLEDIDVKKTSTAINVDRCMGTFEKMGEAMAARGATLDSFLEDRKAKAGSEASKRVHEEEQLKVEAKKLRVESFKLTLESWKMVTESYTSVGLAPPPDVHQKIREIAEQGIEKSPTKPTVPVPSVVMAVTATTPKTRGSLLSEELSSEGAAYQKRINASTSGSKSSRSGLASIDCGLDSYTEEDLYGTDV